MTLTAATIIIIILYAHLNNGFIASSKKYMSYKTKKMVHNNSMYAAGCNLKELPSVPRPSAIRRLQQ